MNAAPTAQLPTAGWPTQLWRFSRPHTIIGTSLSLVALWAMAIGIFPASQTFANADGGAGVGAINLPCLLLAWLACIGANIYIVGLNQLTDIPLDRINKPYLPLAAGAWSVRTGWVVIGLAVLVSLLATAMAASQWLWWTVGLSLALGTAYSLPPFRLKRYNFWAAFCIIAVRSLIVNLLLFAHVARWQADLRDLPAPVWLLTFIMFAFSIAIAWFKDLPDSAGDAAHGVQTLTVRLGRRKVLHYGAGVLVLCLLVAAAAPHMLPMRQVSSNWLSFGQLLVLAIFLVSLKRVDLDQQRSIRGFYLSLWGLFFLEYLLFAAAALVD